MIILEVFYRINNIHSNNIRSDFYYFMFFYMFIGTFYYFLKPIKIKNILALSLFLSLFLMVKISSFIYVGSVLLFIILRIINSHKTVLMKYLKKHYNILFSLVISLILSLILKYNLFIYILPVLIYLFINYKETLIDFLKINLTFLTYFYFV